MTLVWTMLLSPQIDHKKISKTKFNYLVWSSRNAASNFLCYQKKARHSSHGELTRIAGGLCLSLTPKQVIICPWARLRSQHYFYYYCISQLINTHRLKTEAYFLKYLLRAPRPLCFFYNFYDNFYNPRSCSFWSQHLLFTDVEASQSSPAFNPVQ